MGLAILEFLEKFCGVLTSSRNLRLAENLKAMSQVH